MTPELTLNTAARFGREYAEQLAEGPSSTVIGRFTPSVDVPDSDQTALARTCGECTHEMQQTYKSAFNARAQALGLFGRGEATDAKGEKS